MISESLWINNVFVIGFIAFAFIIIFFFIELEANNKQVKLKLRNFFAFVNKYSMVIFAFLNKFWMVFFTFLKKYSIVFYVFFMIVGEVCVIPILNPCGVNIFWFDWYIKNYFMYIRVPLFLTGILLLVIGLILTNRYLRKVIRL